jgi:hypothetical protein
LEFLISVAGNVVANIIFWVGLGGSAWLAISTTHRQLLSFFGLQRNRTLMVYLSNAYKPTQNKPVGGLISEHEFHVIESIRNLFGSTSLRYPELVRGLVDSFWLGESINLKFAVSPQQIDRVQFRNMIVVGGGTRNLLRKVYLERNESYLVTSYEDEIQGISHANVPYIRITRGSRKNTLFEEEGRYNLALIEKIYDRTHNTTVFMCNGLRADSSWAATEYLIRHWRELQRKSENQAFALCLGFPKSKEYMQDYIEPEELTDLMCV